MDQFINGIDQVSSLYRHFGQIKTLVIFLSSQIPLNHAFSRFCKSQLARAWIYNGNRHSLHK